MLRIISILSLLSPLFAALCFLLFCLRCRDNGLWLIFIYVLMSFISDIFNLSLPRSEVLTYLPIFTILEYVLLSAFLFIALTGKKIHVVVKYLTIAVTILLLIIYFRSDKTNFDSISASIESIIIITLSIIYFFEKVNDEQNTFIFNSSYFWVVFAFLIYMAGTLFLFIIAGQNIDKYWFINNFFNIITNLLFCIAFLVQRFGPKNPSSDLPPVDFTSTPNNR